MGHSHNQSDMKTAHAKKALAKKNLYTPQAIVQDGEAVTAKSRVFCADPVGTRKIILIELFNLNSTSDVVEICKPKPRCPPLPQKIISQKKVDNMKVLYQQIPSNCRWYYPEDEEVPFETHTDLRARAVKHGEAPAPSQQVEHEHGTVDPVAGAEGRVVPVAGAEDRVGVTGLRCLALGKGLEDRGKHLQM